MEFTLLSSETVVSAFEGGYREPRIPGVLALKDGSVLLCYEARAQQMGDWGDIDVRVLKKSAKGDIRPVFTYGESTLPPDGHMRTYNNPILFDAGKGHIVLLFCKNYERCFAVHSLDGGEHWGEPAEITENLRRNDYAWNVCAVGPGHGAMSAGGRLVCPVWYAIGKENEDGSRCHAPSAAGCIYSDDGGYTWRTGFLCDKDRNASETDCAALGSRLLFSFRNENPDKKRTFALSENGESLLSDPVPGMTDPTCFGGMCELGSGVLHVNNQNTSKRENLTLSYSENGFEWKSVQYVADISGYADVSAAGNRVFVFFEEWDSNRHLTGRLVLNVYAF